MRRRFSVPFLALAILAGLFGVGLSVGFAKSKSASGKTPAAKKTSASTTKPTQSSSAKAPATNTKRVSSASAKKSGSSRAKKRRRRLPRYSPWNVPTYADSTAGDNIDGDDLSVRRAAVEALGPYNGSVAVVDSSSGRVLTIVNQKLAFSSGYKPCSTIKVPVALAGVKEGIVDSETRLRLGRRTFMDLTEALARSNNSYFEILGRRVGFEKVNYYARQLGLGEKALLDSPLEQPGQYPSQPIAEAAGGVGRMCSFGEGITITPLQLAAMMTAIANGGTLYHLQYPRSLEEIASFAPRVKRHVDMAPQIEEVRPGLLAATEYGTATRATYNPQQPILGKTGTCTDDRTHLGWFASYNEVGDRRLVAVVLLTGGRGVSGPLASEIAGNLFRNLSERDFYRQAKLVPRPGTEGDGGQ